MRLGIVALGNISRTGGGKTVLQGLIHALQKEITPEDQCIIFVSDGQESVLGELEPRVQLIKLPSGTSAAVAEVFNQIVIPYISRRMHLDVLFCPNNRCPVFSPVPTVLMVQVRMFHFVEYDSINKKIGDLITRTSMKVASHILVASANHRDDLLAHIRLSPDKVRVMHLAVDEEKMCELAGSKPPQGYLESLGIYRPYALFVSVLRPYKNLETAIRALDLLVHDFAHDLDLVIVGDYVGGGKDPYKAFIDSIIRESRVGERLHFLGNRSFSEVCKLYAGASLFVFPSRYEGFGLPVLEAMAAGVPVVTSNAWSLPEVGGDAALYINPDDIVGLANAMDRILRDAELREMLVQKGRENVHRFSWRRSASQLYRILKEVASRVQR